MGYLPLKLNDNNEDVRNLHSMLQALNYPVKEVGNHFNEKTQRSVRSFQNDFGLKVTGIVDNNTWNELSRATGNEEITEIHKEDEKNEENLANKVEETKNSEESNITEKEADNKATEEELSNEKTYYPILVEGNNGESVRILQDKLKRLGYFSGSITGVFDSETTESVKIFRFNNGLTSDGIVGPLTWNKLIQLTTSSN